MGIRVLVSGANGKVGKEIIKGILADPALNWSVPSGIKMVSAKM